MKATPPGSVGARSQSRATSKSHQRRQHHSPQRTRADTTLLTLTLKSLALTLILTRTLTLTLTRSTGHLYTLGGRGCGVEDAHQGQQLLDALTQLQRRA